MPGVVVPLGQRPQATRQRCQQCCRDFPHAKALQQHLENSARHRNPPTNDDNGGLDALLLGQFARRGGHDSDDYTNIYNCVRCREPMTERELLSHDCSDSDDDLEHNKVHTAFVRGSDATTEREPKSRSCFDSGSDEKVNWNLNDGRHNCVECNEVFADSFGLIAHWRSRGCRKVCEGCSSGIPDDQWKTHVRQNHACRYCHRHHTSRKQLHMHVRSSGCQRLSEENIKENKVPDEEIGTYGDELDFMCGFCGHHQFSENNLQQHLLTHLPIDRKCWGCKRLFSTEQGIVIHLESGACSSGTCKEELNGWAAEVFQWKHFIRKEWVRRLKNRNPVGQGDLPFYCAGCEKEFSSLSGLFQHCANSSCSQGLDDCSMAKLKHWLVVQLKQCRKLST